MPKVKINDIEMNYEIYGSGDPMVLIMGLGMDMTGWMFQVPTFSKEFRVITPDNRGVGRTSKPKGPYSIKMMADDTAELMRHLNIDSAHIVGVSMGGMISQELALNYPEKVKTLSLCCTYAVPNPGVSSVTRGAITIFGGDPDVGASSVDTSKVDIETIFRFMLQLVLSENFRKENEMFINELLKKMQETEPSVEAFLAQVVATQNHNTVDRLHQINIPTLVFTGTNDILVPPECSDVLASKITGAKLVKLPGGTHGFNWETPDKFNAEIINFIKTVTTR